MLPRSHAEPQELLLAYWAAQAGFGIATFRSTVVPGSLGAVVYPLTHKVCYISCASRCTLACAMTSADLQIMGQRPAGCLPNEGLLGHDALP